VGVEGAEAERRAKRKEGRGKGKEERAKRKEGRGKREEESGKREEGDAECCAGSGGHASQR